MCLIGHVITGQDYEYDKYLSCIWLNYVRRMRNGWKYSCTKSARKIDDIRLAPNDYNSPL